MTAQASRLVCAGCGAEPSRDDPYPFACPAAVRGDDVDHVLRRRLDLGRVRFPYGDDEPDPFVRYRAFLHAYHVATGHGLADEAFCERARQLDGQVAAVAGHGFTATPFARDDALSDALGFGPRGGVWVKDETGNVAGSHKARHLFGVALWLEVADLLGLARRDRPDLAIASCGNAALAAAVVAAAAGRRLLVFVPPDADPAVRARLRELDAVVTTCRREPGTIGDPTVQRLLEAIDAGAVPFTCQGNLNGLAVEGGETLGYEMAADLAAAGNTLDHIVVQVGGGALASAVSAGLREAAALGAIPAPPRLHTVQAEGAWPLRRALDAVVALSAGTPAGVREALAQAAHHRSAFMWPWETAPVSVAHGILDDETYDWLALVEEMLATGGSTVVVGEQALCAANDLARAATCIDVDHTGSAGLAGLVELRASGAVTPDERAAVLFTGCVRHTHDTEGHRDEELSRARHPVAQGL